MAYSGIEIGAVLAGRYRIDRVLGQGGMGIVVQAMHLQLHQPVAVKLLLPEVLANHQVVQRFLREAQAAVRLRSEHVARVIDVGTLDTGAPYMVLEYLEGADLSSFPRAQLSIGGIVDLMLQACEALAEAHSLGIVHRDIKPANFFITRRADGTLLLKVLDFGISKAPALADKLTATQAVMGTPAYMSPEQMRSSHDVDHRTDIWALGVVLYELLQGAPPFGGDMFSSLVLRVVNDPLPKLTVHLPGDLDAIVYRCLEKDPARRFQNTAELAQALAKYAQSATQAAISVQRTRGIVGASAFPSAPERSLVPLASPSTLSHAAGVQVAPRSGRLRWSLVALVGAIVAVAATVTAAVSGGRGDSTTPAARPLAHTAPVENTPAPPPPTRPAPIPPPPTEPLRPEQPPPSTPQSPAEVATPLAAAPSRSPDPAVPVSPTAAKRKRPMPATPARPEAAAPSPKPSADDDVLGTRR
jgi:serine/threonine-protein kinase